MSLEFFHHTLRTTRIVLKTTHFATFATVIDNYVYVFLGGVAASTISRCMVHILHNEINEPPTWVYLDRQDIFGRNLLNFFLSSSVQTTTIMHLTNRGSVFYARQGRMRYESTTLYQDWYSNALSIVPSSHTTFAFYGGQPYSSASVVLSRYFF